jgi:hypothetical protein
MSEERTKRRIRRWRQLARIDAAHGPRPLRGALEKWVAKCRKRKLFSACLLAVRAMPIERFRLPADGRKWKQLAASRASFLESLASRANPDGTFLRGEVNYSPSEIRLARRTSPRSVYRITDALRQLGLLTWERRNNYSRRIYTVHFREEHLPDSSENTCQIRDKSPARFKITPAMVTGDNTCHYDRYPSLKDSVTADAAVASVGSDVSGVGEFDREHKNSHPPYEKQNPKTDDDSSRSASLRSHGNGNGKSAARQTRIKTQAQTILVERGHELPFVTQVLEIIRARARTAPASSAYYLKAFENESPDDWRTWIKINIVHKAIEIADRTGRKTADVLRELMAEASPA